MPSNGRWTSKVCTSVTIDERLLDNIRHEIETRKEHKGEKVVGLFKRNSELKSMLRDMEQDRKEYSELNKKLESEKAWLEKNIASVSEEDQRFKDEIKGVKFSKGTTSKVIESRIDYLRQEVKSIESHNAELRRQLAAKRQTAAPTTLQAAMFDKFDDDFDNCMAVRAKPRLFGDCE